MGPSPKLRHQEDQLAQRQVAIYLAGAQVLLGETTAGPTTSAPFQGQAAKVLVAIAVATGWWEGTPHMGARGGCVLRETLQSVQEALLASIYGAPSVYTRLRAQGQGQGRPPRDLLHLESLCPHTVRSRVRSEFENSSCRQVRGWMIPGVGCPTLHLHRHRTLPGRLPWRVPAASQRL